MRALTRVASAQTENYLLEIALHGTAYHVETLVRQFRRAREAEELSREARQYATRAVSYYHDEDGSLVVKARLPAELGALVIRALDAALAVPAAGERAAGDDVSAETCSARRADALGAVCESFLAHGAAALNGGQRHQIVVHVDAETLQEDGGGRCGLEQGPALGEPLSVGRRTRSVPPALRRALAARDGGCRFPGCTHRRYVDAHHIRHWAHGGQTSASNLVALCRFHHRQVHEGRVSIQKLDGGALRFTRPDGRAFDGMAPGHRQHSHPQQLCIDQRQQGLRIDADTAVTRWAGGRMDYGLAVGVLMQPIILP